MIAVVGNALLVGKWLNAEDPLVYLHAYLNVWVLLASGTVERERERETVSHL